MRFSLQPEPRPEQRMHTVTLDEIMSVCENIPGEKPALEHYFSPPKQQAFIKEFLHYLNSELLEAKHGNLYRESYLALILSFQFTSPLLKIPSEKELGLFFRILEKNYQVKEVDLNLHFSLEQYEGSMVGENEALQAYRSELDDYFGHTMEVKDQVQKRLKKDALASIMDWQREKSLPALAEAFGRTIVIPSFFSFSDRRLVEFYRTNTKGITYRVAVPDTIE